MISSYTASDKEAVLSIWKSASAIAHPFLDQQVVDAAEAMIRDVLLDQAEIWLAKDGGDNLGFIALLGDEVGGLFVSPTCQGRGIGQQLLGKARETRTELVLSVFTENMPARGFYKAYGFVEEARQTSDFFGHEEIRMRLAPA